jgi:hypothetical protein
LFVLVKGNLQGATKAASSKNLISISKKSFLNSFKTIYQNYQPQEQEENIKSLNYMQAKQLATDYNTSSSQFYSVYKDWLRSDQEKYYKFC